MRWAAAAGLVALLAGAGPASAQPGGAPDFAPPNLTPAGVRALAANCAPCHGPEGRPVPGSAIPALAGRSRDALAAALEEFKAGRRPATVMHQIARGYSDAEMAALAAYFAGAGR